MDSLEYDSWDMSIDTYNGFTLVPIILNDLDQIKSLPGNGSHYLIKFPGSHQWIPVTKYGQSTISKGRLANLTDDGQSPGIIGRVWQGSGIVRYCHEHLIGCSFVGPIKVREYYDN